MGEGGTAKGGGFAARSLEKTFEIAARLGAIYSPPNILGRERNSNADRQTRRGMYHLKSLLAILKVLISENHRGNFI